MLALLGIPLASMVWALRPQIASLLFLMVLMHLLVRQRFWMIPPLFVVWANLHGAVALGGVVLVAATVVAWFDATGAVSAVAAGDAPGGSGDGRHPDGDGPVAVHRRIDGRSRQNQIMEWLPSYPNGPIEIAFWLGAMVLLVLTWRRWRQLERWEDRLVVAAALILLPLAARAVRNISPFFLLWMPAMSRLIGRDASLPRWVRWRRSPAAPGAAAAPGPTGDIEHPWLNVALVILAAIGAVGAVAAAGRAPVKALGWRPLAPGAIAAVGACPGAAVQRIQRGGLSDLVRAADAGVPGQPPGSLPGVSLDRSHRRRKVRRLQAALPAVRHRLRGSPSQQPGSPRPRGRWLDGALPRRPVGDLVSRAGARDPLVTAGRAARGRKTARIFTRLVSHGRSSKLFRWMTRR